MGAAVSCASHGNFGSIRENHQVTSSYRSYEVNPQYQYFYYGRFLEPDAILGIDRSFEVRSQLWKPIDLDQDQLETWVITLDRRSPDQEYNSRYPRRYQGSYVTDPNGTVVGTWYSKLDWGVFEFSEPNVIVPYAPSLKPGSTQRIFRVDD